MDFSLSEDHLALREAANKFLTSEVDLSVLLVHGRNVTDTNYEGLWKKMAELGWSGIVVPEAYGGLGMDCIDLCMIVGEVGRTLAPSPMFGTLAGAWAVEKVAPEATKQTLLSEVAAGSLKLSLAIADVDNIPGKGVKARKQGDDLLLSGEKHFVVDAEAADKIIVSGEDGAFFVVDKDAKGVSVALVEWRDITRQVGTITFKDAKAQLLGTDEKAWPWIRDRLYLVLAAESAAGIEASLQDAVTYAKERIAFGRPIGAFQAIKHHLSELAGKSECATAAVQYAAWALSTDQADASRAAAMAHCYASEAYKATTHRNIQIFGAIGFTWEMKNHLYYKRARANSELLGPPRQQREEVIASLEAEKAA
jgi:alkylation response protein AidB-like acyl-CoA dehydrogenase